MKQFTEFLCEGLDALGTVQKVASTHSAQKFRWPDGETTLIDAQTANLLVTLYDKLSPEMKQKTVRMINHSLPQFLKIVDFAWSKAGFRS